MTLRRILGVKRLSIPSIRDIQPLVPGERVRFDGLCRCDAVFPLLLHLGVHDEEGVVREVNGDLAFFVCASEVDCFGGVGVSARRWTTDNLPDTEFAGNTEGKAADYSARTEIRELIGVVAYLELVLAVFSGKYVERILTLSLAPS